MFSEERVKTTDVDTFSDFCYNKRCHWAKMFYIRSSTNQWANISRTLAFMGKSFSLWPKLKDITSCNSDFSSDNIMSTIVLTKTEIKINLFNVAVVNNLAFGSYLIRIAKATRIATNYSIILLIGRPETLQRWYLIFSTLTDCPYVNCCTFKPRWNVEIESRARSCCSSA